MARIVPTILLHFLQSLPASCLPRHLCLHVHRPWRSDVGGTSPWTGEGSTMQEQLSRITLGTVIERTLRTSNEVHLRTPLGFVGHFLRYSPVALSIF